MTLTNSFTYEEYLSETSEFDCPACKNHGTVLQFRIDFSGFYFCDCYHGRKLQRDEANKTKDKLLGVARHF